ncbi:MAG: hypothetical protein M1475_02330 [Actinobacteria bacterium]|nr:hypothetical protein [Actinomycetota bacterium]
MEGSTYRGEIYIVRMWIGRDKAISFKGFKGISKIQMKNIKIFNGKRNQTKNKRSIRK